MWRISTQQSEPENKGYNPKHNDHIMQTLPLAGEFFPLRILLAEDNRVNQKFALLMLRKFGYQADVAINGVQVLQALHHQPYDVVLMDIEMPEMDGLTATRHICQTWSAGDRPRIIALTAYALQEDREKCLAAGMDDYVTKPICWSELIKALQKVAHIKSGGIVVV